MYLVLQGDTRLTQNKHGISSQGYYQHIVKHEHSCDCSRGDFKEWLPHIAQSFFWFDIQDVGSYQGNVYGVAIYNGKIAIYEDYYGSCSGCGAWGEGGEPQDENAVIALCHLFNDKIEALEYVGKMDQYYSPDKDSMFLAIHKADDWRKTRIEEGRTA